MINNFSMLNSVSPLALILIACGILLVAAGVIVYFFLFHKKLMKHIQEKSAEKARDRQAKAQASGFVEDFFKKEQGSNEREPKKKLSDEERRAMFVQTRQAALNVIKAENAQSNVSQRKNKKGGK